MPQPRRKPDSPDANAKPDDKPAPDAPDANGGDEGEDPNAIKRENLHGWWCPLCDHSQSLVMTSCQNCGATREGDRVVPAGKS